VPCVVSTVIVLVIYYDLRETDTLNKLKEFMLKSLHMVAKKKSWNIILLIGCLWIVIWAILFVLTPVGGMLNKLYDSTSPLSFNDGLILANTLFYIPFVIGSVAIVLGAVVRRKYDKGQKLLAIALGSIFVSAFICAAARMLYFVINY